MTAFDASNYAPAVTPLLSGDRLPELGPGSPNRSAEPALAALTPEGLFPQLSDRSMALACISGLWLLHDFLDESHRISQDIDTPTGSYWHGIMHRREPDPDNAKYWFRRVGRHPVFEELARDAAELRYLGTGMAWEPFVFVDHCEQHRGAGDEAELTLRKVQLAEWRLLFAWCWRRAARG